jgi:predicted DNA-binding transcriptional regulator YafY
MSSGESHELVMDVLRHGAGVEVLAPSQLREAVKEHLRAAMTRYL